MVKDTQWRLAYDMWKVAVCNLAPFGIAGQCDPSVKTIRLHRNLDPDQLLDTIIHECIHAETDLTEGRVTMLATDIAAALKQTGFRLDKRRRKR